MGRPVWWGAGLAALAAVLLAAPWPVLDEESYLAIAAQLDPLRPYDWWRPWPPWGETPAPDAFVYAHPPLFLLWVWLLTQLPLSLPLPLLKGLSGLPWALLYGASAGLLAEQVCRRPGLAVGVWLASPVVLLSLGRGLMPDLPVVALSTAAVAGWLWGGRAALLGGLCWGLAVETKYPALVLLPALLADAWGRRRWQPGFWGAALAPVLAGEAWLWLAYGRPHLWEVLSRVDEIPRGPLGGRLAGVLVRSALLAPLPLLLLAPPRLRAAVSALLGGCAAALLGGAAGLGAWGAAGGLAAGAALRERWQAGPPLLLAVWSLCALLAVVVGHNFAATRYLLPVALPTVLLLTRALEGRLATRRLLIAGATLWLGGGLLASHAERRYAAAAVALADTAAARWPEGGQFSGEWTFRWRMEQHGWRFYAGTTAASAGGVVVMAREAAPAAPGAGWTEIARVPSEITGRVRLVDAEAQVGWYGETLGRWPLAVRRAPSPLEEITAWRAP